MSVRTAVRLAVAAGVIAVPAWAAAITWNADPAAAASTVTKTVDIRVGDSGTLGGTAEFTRTLQADGTEVLVARGHLLRPSVNSSICLSHEEFTRARRGPGCPSKVEETTEVVYTLDLGTEYVGQVLHIQFRVRMPEFPDKPDLANGYAGWHANPQGHDKGDQYGEVAIPPTTSPSPSPSSSPTSPTSSPSPSPTTSPSPSPTESPSPSPSSSPSASPSTSVSPTPSTSPPASPPTSVNAGSGGGAGPRSAVLPVLLLVAGLVLAVASGRWLAENR